MCVLPRTLLSALLPSYKRPKHAHSRQKEFSSQAKSRLSIPFKINPALHQVKERSRLLSKFLDLVWVYFFPLSCDQLKNLRQNSESYHSKTIESVNVLGRKQASSICFSLFCCTNTFVWGFCFPLLPLSCTSK